MKITIWSFYNRETISKSDFEKKKKKLLLCSSYLTRNKIEKFISFLFFFLTFNGGLVIGFLLEKLYPLFNISLWKWQSQV